MRAVSKSQPCIVLLGALVVQARAAQALEREKNDVVPKALVNAYANRGRAKSVQFRYNVRLELDGYLEARMEYWEARFSGKQVYLIERCDPDGIRSRDPITGFPNLGMTGCCLPQSSLTDLETSVRWSKPAGVGHLAQDPLLFRHDFRDPRIAGLRAQWDQNMSPEAMLTELLGYKGRWTERTERGLLHETFRRHVPPNADIEVEWLIDPEKDFAVLSTQITDHVDGRPDRVSMKAVTDYAVQDGRWWPTRSESFEPGAKYRIIVNFESVEFDRPEHAKRLTPDIFGLPAGVVVHKIGTLGGAKSQVLRYIGNGQTVSEGEWERIKDNFDLAALNASLRKSVDPSNHGAYPSWWNDASGEFGLPGVAGKIDDWEAYVRRWIAKHRPGHTYEPIDPLDEKQVNAAWAILEDCRKQARAILDSPAHHAAPTTKPAASQPADPRIAPIFTQLTRRLDGTLREKQLGVTPPIKPRPAPKMPQRPGK